MVIVDSETDLAVPTTSFPEFCANAEEASAQRGPEDDAPKTTNAPASPWKSLKIVLSLLSTS